LSRIPDLRIGVLGDLFLDRYLDIDAALTEPSLETGLDAYQVVRVRSYPGAAGTVINNLVALGVKRVYAISVIGDDGEGRELWYALGDLKVVNRRRIERLPGGFFRTPTYTKPMLQAPGQPARELNRLDIKNRTPPGRLVEDMILHGLEQTWCRLDALVVVDQVSDAEYGVVTPGVRQRLADLGASFPSKMILVDSRHRIASFRSVWLKPNQSECVRAVGGAAGPDAVTASARELVKRTGRPVFCTCGEQGTLLVDPRYAVERVVRVPAYPVHGPIDVVGAGDSTSAAIACAIAARADSEDAAAFGNLVASITIQQIGVTGTASPEQVWQRWREVSGV
jgi:rfaE bifunctional protein kinase chain/domain